MLSYLKDWGALKEWLGVALDVDHSLLHLHLGLAVFVLVHLSLRQPFGAWLPFVVVTILEVGNELADYARYHLSHWPWTPGNTVADLVNTLLWPLVLTVAARLLPPRAAVQVVAATAAPSAHSA